MEPTSLIYDAVIPVVLVVVYLICDWLHTAMTFNTYTTNLIERNGQKSSVVMSMREYGRWLASNATDVYKLKQLGVHILSDLLGRWAPQPKGLLHKSIKTNTHVVTLVKNGLETGMFKLSVTLGVGVVVVMFLFIYHVVFDETICMIPPIRMIALSLTILFLIAISRIVAKVCGRLCKYWYKSYLTTRIQASMFLVDLSDKALQKANPLGMLSKAIGTAGGVLPGVADLGKWTQKASDAAKTLVDQGKKTLETVQFVAKDGLEKGKGNPENIEQNIVGGGSMSGIINGALKGINLDALGTLGKLSGDGVQGIAGDFMKQAENKLSDDGLLESVAKGVSGRVSGILKGVNNELGFGFGGEGNKVLKATKGINLSPSAMKALEKIGSNSKIDYGYIIIKADSEAKENNSVPAMVQKAMCLVYDYDFEKHPILSLFRLCTSERAGTILVVAMVVVCLLSMSSVNTCMTILNIREDNKFATPMKMCVVATGSGLIMMMYSIVMYIVVMGMVYTLVNWIGEAVQGSELGTFLIREITVFDHMDVGNALGKVKFWRYFPQYVLHATVLFGLAIAFTVMIVGVYIYVIDKDLTVSENDRKKYTLRKFMHLFQGTLVLSLIVCMLSFVVVKCLGIA